jgi:hypothetical protein
MAPKWSSGTPKFTKMGSTWWITTSATSFSFTRLPAMHQQVSGASGDGRVDLAVAEVELRLGHRRLVAGQGGARGIRPWLRWRARWRGPRRAWSGLIGGHFGGQIFLVELLLPGGVGFGELGLRLVACQVGFGLRHLRFGRVPPPLRPGAEASS